jgi:molybdopterin converting factor small subunit
MEEIKNEVELEEQEPVEELGDDLPSQPEDIDEEDEENIEE